MPESSFVHEAICCGCETGKNAGALRFSGKIGTASMGVSVTPNASLLGAISSVFLRGGGGSGADRIVGAIRSGVRYGDAAYAAMTCRQITAGFDCNVVGIANWRL